MTQVWTLPGYDVRALIGSGAGGQVWRAREIATGEDVALRRLVGSADPVVVQRLRERALLLRTLDTPYVVRLREVLRTPDDTVLVLDLAAGGSLATLLARRGILDAGEVVTVGAPMARALAAAHACGLVHGDVRPAKVLFTAAGMPLLAGLEFGAGLEADAASDVRALGALCHELLAGAPPRAPGTELVSAPRPLAAAIELALQADPTLRPDAAGFASALRRAHPPAPVRWTSAAQPPAAPAQPVRSAGAPGTFSTASSARRRVGVAIGAAGLIALAAVAGWLSGRSGPVAPTAMTAAVAPPSAPDWLVVLDRLDAVRAAAFATGDVGALLQVHAPGSALLAADRQALDRLLASGQRARGVRHAFRSVAVASHDGRSAELRVVDRLAAYDVLDSSGRVVQRTRPRPERAFVVTVLRTSKGWRLQRVAPA